MTYKKKGRCVCCERKEFEIFSCVRGRLGREQKEEKKSSWKESKKKHKKQKSKRREKRQKRDARIFFQRHKCFFFFCTSLSRKNSSF